MLDQQFLAHPVLLRHKLYKMTSCRQSLTHPGGTRLVALLLLLLLLLVVLMLMQLSELTSTFLDAQQQPDELVALLLGKVQLVSSSQLVD